jgi:hypothetical protein
LTSLKDGFSPGSTVPQCRFAGMIQKGSINRELFPVENSLREAFVSSYIGRLEVAV